MTTTTTTAAATPDVRSARARIRALAAAGGALAAAAAWLIEVPGLGVHLAFRFGAGPVQVVGVGQVIGISVAAALAGWLLLAVLERRARRPRAAWAGAALLGLAASLALPLAAATTAAAAAGLAALHLAVGAVVIPALARTARPR